MRICAFQHCSSSNYQLNKWKAKDCSIHHGTKHQQCGCKPPFVLFPFPTSNSPEARTDWIRAVNRKDPKTGKNWKPNFDSRVCSLHFVEGKPSESNPSPSINLVDATSSASTYHFVPKRKRALPHRSHTSAKKPKLSNNTSEEQDKQDNSEKDHLITNINNNDHDYTLPTSSGGCNCRRDCNCAGCLSKDLEIARLKDKLEKAYAIIYDINKQEKVVTPTGKFTINDSKVSFYTCLPNKIVLTHYVSI